MQHACLCGETHRGDLLFTTEAPMGYCAICEMKRCSCGQRVITLQNYGTVGPDNALFCQIILSPLFQIQVKDHATGTTAKGIKAAVLKELFLPIPPLAEQRRIVERVNELMPLVEEYGELEDAREELDAALPGRLRKSVLQLAVQGGLVPQDPADEPAGVLLERIRGQRRQLVAEGEMKAPKGGESIIFAGSDGRRYEKRVDARGRESEPVCIEDEIPFEIPESWEWARLESVTTYIQRGKSPKYSTVEKYPVIAQKCNQWSGFSVEKARFIDPATVSKYADERILKDGDLLWNSTGLGTLGRMAVYDSAKNRYGWAVADSHVTVIRTREDWLDHRFAFAYFAGPSVQSEIEDQASGSTKQKELAQETVRNYLIPVPPLAEQRRIVYEVDWLFKILV
ncbi:MAG: restriction endonuclease subunit S [Collinsella sp.]